MRNIIYCSAPKITKHATIKLTKELISKTNFTETKSEIKEFYKPCYQSWLSVITITYYSWILDFDTLLEYNAFIA